MQKGASFLGREFFFQCFNFCLFFAALLFLARKPIRDFFKQRKQNFLSFQKEAEQQEKEQLKRFSHLENKIKEIQSKEKTIEKAAQEQGKLFLAEKEKELQDWKKIRQQEQDFLIGLEREKIKQELFVRWKEEIFVQVQKKLEQEASHPDFHKKMNQSFIKAMGQA